MPNNEGKGNGKKGKGKKAVEILGKLRFPGDEHWQKLQLRLFANQVETLKKELADAEANPDSDYVDSARLREELVFVERKRTAIQEGNIILHVFQEEREDNIILRELQKENIMLGVNPASSLEAGAAHQAESARRSRSRRSRSPAWRRSSSPSSAQSEKARDEAIAEKMIAEAATGIPGEELRRCFECVKPVGPPVEPVERPTGPQDTETAEPAKQEQHVKTQTAEPVKQEQLANVKTETAKPVKQEQVHRQWKAGDLRMNGPAGNLEIAEHAYVEGCCWSQSFCQNNCNTRRLINKRNYTLPQEVIILSK